MNDALNIQFQSNHNTKHAFVILEGRLAGFEVLVTASESDTGVTAADNEYLQILLHAAGV